MDVFSSADPYLKAYTQSARGAAQASSNALTLPDLLKQALNEKLSQSPIIGERSEAAGRFLSGLSEAPARVLPEQTGGIVLSPTQQSSIIGAQRSANLVPLMSANQRYDLLTGTIGDIVGQASRAYQGQAQLAQSESKIAQDLYQNMIDRLYKSAQIGIEQAKLAKSSGTLTAQQQKTKDAINSLDAGLTRLLTLRDKLQKGEVSSGFGAGISTFLQRLIPGYTPSKGVRAVQNDISQINQSLFDVAGKAFTEPERQLLPGLILREQDSPDVLTDKVDRMIQDFMTRKALISSSGLTGDYTQAFQETTNEWEDIGYIP